jgi:hypothetical protein
MRRRIRREGFGVAWDCIGSNCHRPLMGLLRKFDSCTKTLLRAGLRSTNLAAITREIVLGSGLPHSAPSWRDFHAASETWPVIRAGDGVNHSTFGRKGSWPSLIPRFGCQPKLPASKLGQRPFAGHSPFIQGAGTDERAMTFGLRHARWPQRRHLLEGICPSVATIRTSIPSTLPLSPRLPTPKSNRRSTCKPLRTPPAISCKYLKHLVFVATTPYSPRAEHIYYVYPTDARFFPYVS